MDTVIAYTGGAARGNPGPAGIGVYIVEPGPTLVYEVGQTIGNSTTNFAEYQAVMVCLQSLIQLYSEATQTTHFDIHLDSELVKKQLNHESTITEPGLVPMFIEIHNLRVASFPYLTLTLISRTENEEVNRLVSEVLDGKG